MICYLHINLFQTRAILSFSSNRDGDYEIYRMNLDGTNLVKLTNNDINDTSPVIDQAENQYLIFQKRKEIMKFSLWFVGLN